MKILIPFVLALCAPLSFVTRSAMADASDTGPRALPIIWNGNLCEPDSTRLCLGVQGLGRDTWVDCMREHYSQLTLDCQEVMSLKNFKPEAGAANSNANPRAANPAAGY
jgi:hypothetical protein